VVRILVTGSRDWDNRLTISREVFRFINETCPYLRDEKGNPIRRDWSDVVIVHGACSQGADALVEDFANHLSPPIKTEPHPANWAAFGKRAGLERNKEMARLGAEVCLAFINPCRKDDCLHLEIHGSHGAEDAVRQATLFGIEVRISNHRKIRP